MIEAVVFDLDGVLIQSEPIWEEVRHGFVQEHGGHWATDAQVRLMGMSTGEWARYLGEDLGVGLPPTQVANIVVARMAERLSESLPLVPGAPQAVRLPREPLAPRAGQLIAPPPDRRGACRVRTGGAIQRDDLD